MKAALVGLGLMLGSAVGIRPAWAGMCEAEDAKPQIAALEAYARKPGKEKPDLDPLCMESVQEVPRLARRVIEACALIIPREPDVSSCLEWSAKFGAKHLGKVELFAAVQAAFVIDPFLYNSQTMKIYEALGDERAVPLVRQEWEAALVDKRSRQPRHAHAFKVWRHAALRIFGALGTAVDQPFLESQAAGLGDRGLQKALKKAIEAIERRARGT